MSYTILPEGKNYALYVKYSDGYLVRVTAKKSLLEMKAFLEEKGI
jgi:hypothetical protein